MSEPPLTSDPAPTPPPRDPMPRLGWQRPSRKALFRALSWAGAGLATLVLIFGFWIYRQSVGRFQLRRLRLPTRVYADYTPLRAGLPWNRDELIEKLDRLGYREVDALGRAGDFHESREGVDIYTRAFEHPSGDYPEQKIRVSFGRSSVDAVTSLSGTLRPAALEPELLTSILTEQLENRSPVTLDQVPEHLRDAVVATEDVRFWRHPGVDPIGILRATWRNIRAGGVEEGASTLTQQLVKNYFLTSERTFRRKIVEAFMALILDARYSKEEILEAYLNDIYLGRSRSISILGVGEASRFYFGKPVSEIDLAEAALLAGMIRSPNNYSPFENPRPAMRRRNAVLGKMLDQGMIAKAEYDAARSERLPSKPFHERRGLSSIPYYVDRVRAELETDYGIDDIQGRGLRIYTAIDLDAQDAATRILDSSLRGIEKYSRRIRNHRPRLDGALIHVDVPTGEIRALVGGRSYERSQFNRALASKRPVGSLFKAFVYLTAFEPSLSNQNITEATVVTDRRFILKRRWSKDWSPRNYENRYLGDVTVEYALEQSLNCASVRIGLACGIGPVVHTAHVLGVKTEMDDDNPAILLGAAGIPPIEMAAAYTTIARQGSLLPLRAIRFVTDERGRTLERKEAEPTQVFPQRDVYLLTDVMKNVMNRGTAASARAVGFRKIAAGKTGTTNDKRDAWFIGFTPRTLALTWVGFDDNAPTGLSGSKAAVPMWARYMMNVTADQPDEDFPSPPGITVTMVDRISGGLATPYCPPENVTRMAFKEGTEPNQLCSLHRYPPAPIEQPLYDEFGNPIPTDTTATSDTTGTTAPPDATLTGGIFPTDTGPRVKPPVNPLPMIPPPPTPPAPPEKPAPPPTDTSPPTATPPPASPPTSPPTSASPEATTDAHGSS